jgi:CO/xanthine dehydrogenase Mo-binding subunit
MTTTAEPTATTSTDGHKYIGKPVTRVEGAGKVTGETVYAADIVLPDMLHVKLVRSPHAHALIKGIETSRARQVEGVEHVVTAADLPQFEARRKSNRAYVILADDEVVFYGQPVAAVLARTMSVAEEAADLVRVDYEELPAVLDPVEAVEDSSPLARKPVSDIDRSESQGHVTLKVDEKAADKPSNIASQVKFTRGDVEQGFADADVIVEHTWKSPYMHQGYIEPHATVADFDAASGELTIWTATQGQFFVRDQLAHMLKIPATKIRVIGTELGGGFGGKILLTQSLCAVLAFIAKRPVKLVFSRTDDLLGATPSGAAVVELKTGMKKDGSLTAIQGRLLYETGAFPGAPAVVGAILLGGYYNFPNLLLESYEVLTNKVSVGAIRAPGAHNATFAIESHMDMMARDLGLDPVDVRLKNIVGSGDQMPGDQPWPRIGSRETVEAARASEVWTTRGNGGAPSDSTKKRGTGFALGAWLGGLQPASAVVELNGDGTINVVVGANDITGTNTSLTQIAGEVLDLPLDRIRVSTGDTRSAPFAGMSAGSKTLFTVGRAVKQATEDVREQILKVAGERLGANPEDELECSDGEVRVKGQPEKAITFQRIAGITTGFGAQYAPIVGHGAITARKQAPGFTAQVAEVEVDTETGELTLLRFAIAQDAGFAINPLNVAGQMQGGSTQGIGIAMSEEMVYDDKGQLRNPSLLDYRMPTAMDVPDIETHIVEVPSEDGPYGARGVGEPSIIAGAAAITNAIYDACGARLDTIPATPERVLRALGKL